MNIIEENSYIPGTEEDKQTNELLTQLEGYLEEKEALEEQTAEEYFLMLLAKGIEARKEGNYGIAAALVLRSNGIEIIVFGKNTVFSEQNPHGHAEMNAVKNATLALQSDEAMMRLISTGDLIVRESQFKGEETLLVTTLEPCPMCTVGSIINAKINRVLIATPDEFAGASQQDRMESLAPLWANTAREQGLEITFAQSDDPLQGDTYANPELIDYLNDLFFQTKLRLDEKLNNEGFVNLIYLVTKAGIKE